jgi:hypothetical protein
LEMNRASPYRMIHLMSLTTIFVCEPRV